MMRELVDYYNSLPDPRPQALLEQQAEMTREQLETHRRQWNPTVRFKRPRQASTIEGPNWPSRNKM
jgi:hypothetical protein